MYLMFDVCIVRQPGTKNIDCYGWCHSAIMCKIINRMAYQNIRRPTKTCKLLKNVKTCDGLAEKDQKLPLQKQSKHTFITINLLKGVL